MVNMLPIGYSSENYSVVTYRICRLSKETCKEGCKLEKCKVIRRYTYRPRYCTIYVHLGGIE